MNQQQTVITAEQIIGVAEVELTAIQDLFDDTRSGSFFHVRGYEAANGYGEVADYFLQHGVNYDSIKRKSDAILQRILDGEETTVTVRHGIWITPDDLNSLTDGDDTSESEVMQVTFKYNEQLNNTTIKVEKNVSISVSAMDCFSNRKGKGRIPAEVQYEVKTGSPLLIAAVEAALEGIRNPRHVDHGYEKYAKGGYYRAKDGEIRLYIRDCLRVHKIVRTKGEYPFKASLPKSAVRQAVERLTPKGRYRAFIFDGRFEDVTMSGMSILMDGIDETMYFADPADYKAAKARKEELCETETCDNIQTATSATGGTSMQ